MRPSLMMRAVTKSPPTSTWFLHETRLVDVFLCIENAVIHIEFLILLRPVGLRHASSAMMRFEQAVESLPMREAGRFKAKNLKWTAKDYKSYADSHANALLEFRFTKGDKIAVWMAPCDHKVINHTFTRSSRSPAAFFTRVNVCICNTSMSVSWPTRKWECTCTILTPLYPA